MTDKQWIEAYITRTKEQQKEIKQYYDEMYRNAIFPETFELAEKYLKIIKSIEEM